MSKVFDLFIIGGGINGAGLARDAAGRGLSVCLADKGEIGGATSSWSTKLIHGGLRYLENYEFKLVRESLKERETTLDGIWSDLCVDPLQRGRFPEDVVHDARHVVGAHVQSPGCELVGPHTARRSVRARLGPSARALVV